ncbi:MAG: MFS transporter [Candidatus Latescibacteria bacterium]|nr:MFS transporter [Candidatus Latescibacterota bacterium]
MEEIGGEVDRNRSETDVVASAQRLTPGRTGAHRKWWVLVAIGVGTFMSALDGSVVNAILPVIQRAFGSDVATIEWVITVYLLMVSGVLLSFGRLGDLRGHKPVYLLGFAVFILSSMFCGLAPSAFMLIVFRALQALGGAMLFANAPAILTKNFPSTQRGQALGLLSMMTYLGLTLGPPMGGWLTDQLSWRAVFYVNVPIGCFAFWLSARWIPHDSAAKQAERFDLAGAVIFTAGLIALLLGLNQGHALGWTSIPIMALLAVAGLLLGVFLVIERRVPHPMLDLSLFQSRLFSAATASAVFNYVSVYSIVFLLPFYLIQGRQLSPTHTGLLLTALPIIMAIAAPLSGTLSDRIGSRFLSTLGMMFLATGLFLLSRLDAQSPLREVTLALAVSGLGTGLFISPNSSALLGAAPRHRQGIASGILATARNVGMVLGVGLTGAIFTTVLTHGRTSGSATRLFDAVSASFLVASGVAILGALTSVTRGR